MAPSTRHPVTASYGGQGGRLKGLPEGDAQPVDPRQPPVDVERLGDPEARAAKAASLFRPRFSTRWSR
jgi:hypothetical protein